MDYSRHLSPHLMAIAPGAEGKHGGVHPDGWHLVTQSLGTVMAFVHSDLGGRYLALTDRRRHLHLLGQLGGAARCSRFEAAPVAEIRPDQGD